MPAPTEDLAAALDAADLPILLMSLVHLTGDRRWIEPPFTPQRDGQIFADESGGLPPEVQEEIRAAALEILSDPAVFDRRALELSDELVNEMMSTCVGEPVPPEYVPMMLREMGFRPAEEPEGLGDRLDGRNVVVIGAGLSGVATAVRLQRLGIDYTVLEKNPSVGGTWWANVYPECGVDTPNHYYSYSFNATTEWTSYFSKQPEILGYIEETVERFGLRDHLRLGVTVEALHWDEAAQGWTLNLRNADGSEETMHASFVISAVGLLDEPRIPAIEGLGDFGGQMFHTARWPADADLSGKRVALVGSGASGLQAARSMAAEAEHLAIFQRSPHWITPNGHYHRKVGDGKRWLLRHVPYYAAWYRFALFWRYSDGIHSSLVVDPEWPHPERSVNERNDRHRRFLTRYLESELEGRPDLIEKCLPAYPPYGKRMLVDNDWFKTLRRENVELVTDPIARFTTGGIETADGAERPFDVVVLATGFHATRALWPMRVFGRDGTDIHEFWNDDETRALLGITVPNYPNFFMLLGPNTGLAHGGSAIFQIETQLHYVLRCLDAVADRDAGAIEPRREPYEAWIEENDAAHEGMVFTHPGMTNWYENRAGRIVTITPFRLVDYWTMTREPRPEDFSFTPRGAVRTA